MKQSINTTVEKIEVSEDEFVKLMKELNYCTENGHEYRILHKGNKAGVFAFITDDNYYMLNKEDLREMSETASILGIDHVTLFTNFGLELHSVYETPKTVGFDHIVKKSFQ